MNFVFIVGALIAVQVYMCCVMIKETAPHQAYEDVSENIESQDPLQQYKNLEEGTLTSVYINIEENYFED